MSKAKRFPGRDERHLKPVNTNRLPIARFRPVHDPDVIPRLEHLLRRLSKPAFVTVGRGDREKPGEPNHQAKRNQQHARPPRIEDIHGRAL